MADRDWVKYQSIRGKVLPETGEWLGARWRLEKVLKFDFYAATGLYTSDEPSPRQVLLKVYHQDPLGFLPLGWLGRMLCKREADSLKTVAAIQGIPKLLTDHGRAGFIREFVPGQNLREHGKYAGLRDDFFPRLKSILAQVHALGLSHDDLSKPENILVGDDGTPHLIDFQIALGAQEQRSWMRVFFRPLIRYMQGVDRYHLLKIHRRFRPFDFTADQIEAARKKGWVIHLHGFIRRPYRKVRHFVLDRYLTKPGARP